MNAAPNCFECIHSRSIPGDCHLACAKASAKVEGDETGIRRGWFFWPFNFDPVWLRSCDSFAPKSEKDLSVKHFC